MHGDLLWSLVPSLGMRLVLWYLCMPIIMAMCDCINRTLPAVTLVHWDRLLKVQHMLLEKGTEDTLPKNSLEEHNIYVRCMHTSWLIKVIMTL